MDPKFWLGYLSEWLGVVAVMMIAGISPLLKRVRRIEFRFPKRETTFALSIFALVFLFAFQYFSNSIFAFLRTAADGFTGGELADRAIIAVIALVPFLVALLARGQPFKSIGWSKENTRAGLVSGLMLVVLVVFLRGKFTTLLKGLTPEQGSLLLILLVLCLAEETIFRGYIQLRLYSYLGKTWGWLATVVLFVLWQLPGRLGVLPTSELWPVLGIALVQGLLLGWIMRKTGHVATGVFYRAVAAWLLLI